MKEITNCVICNSSQHRQFLVCKDFTVSKQNFTIQQCSDCGFKFTSPRPEDKDLGNYYKSEEYVSHSDTKKGLINKLYHWVRNYTLIKKLQLLIHYSGKKGGSILDYGCGTGAFLNICSKNKWQTYGIEPDSDARNFAITNYMLNVSKDVSEAIVKLKGNQVNAITMWHVLEHVSDLEELFSFIKQSLIANGILIIAVPNCSSYDAKYYGVNWAAYDVPRHLYHFTPKDIERLLTKQGFKLEKTLPMIFDSFYVSMLSEKYKSGSINYMKAFYRGLISNFKANKTGKEFSSQIYVFRKQ